MLFKLLADYKQLRAGISSMYQDEGAQAGKIRAEHLSAVMRLTPYAMAANVGSALLVLWALHRQHGPGLYLWFLALVAVAVAAVHRWAQRQGKPLQQSLVKATPPLHLPCIRHLTPREPRQPRALNKA